jgi:hypothetical protein
VRKEDGNHDDEAGKPLHEPEKEERFKTDANIVEALVPADALNPIQQVSSQPKTPDQYQKQQGKVYHGLLRLPIRVARNEHEGQAITDVRKLIRLQGISHQKHQEIDAKGKQQKGK